MLGVFQFENLLGDLHLQFIDHAQVGECPGFFAVKYLGSVQVDFQASFVRGRHLDGDVAGGVGTEELGRQPRGDGIVASSYAVDNLSFYFSVF